MKKALSLLFCAMLCFSQSHAQTYQPTDENLQSRKEFSDSKLGIFIHWGIYSMFAQGEWYMTNKNVDSKE